jgi:hypothetical protein
MSWYMNQLVNLFKGICFGMRILWLCPMSGGRTESLAKAESGVSSARVVKFGGAE